MPVDVVYTWVNSSDPNWIAQLHFFSNRYHLSIDEERYPSTNRNSDAELETSVLSVGRFAPWVRYIWVVTQRPQSPGFLYNPEFAARYPSLISKIRIVHHETIFQGSFSEDLPTFNSHSIEAHVHRIPGLSEHFLYMNDDLIFGNYAFIPDFFASNGFPLYRTELKHTLRPLIPDRNGFHNAWANVGELLGMWPLLPRPWHTVVPLTRQIMQDSWEAWHFSLKQTSQLQFRALGGKQVPPIGISALWALELHKAYQLPHSWPLSFFGYGVGQYHASGDPLPPATTTLCLNDNHPDTQSSLGFMRDVLMRNSPPPLESTSDEVVVIFVMCPISRESPNLENFSPDIFLGSLVLVICFKSPREESMPVNYLTRTVAGLNQFRSLHAATTKPISLVTIDLESHHVEKDFIERLNSLIFSKLVHLLETSSMRNSKTQHTEIFPEHDQTESDEEPWITQNQVHQQQRQQNLDLVGREKLEMGENESDRIPYPILLQKHNITEFREGPTQQGIGSSKRAFVFVTYPDTYAPWEEEWTDEWLKNKERNSLYPIITNITKSVFKSFSSNPSFSHFLHSSSNNFSFENNIERWCEIPESRSEEDDELRSEIFRVVNVAAYPQYVTGSREANIFFPLGWRQRCQG